MNIYILVLNIDIIHCKNIDILLENIDKLDILFEYLYVLVLSIDILLLINIDTLLLINTDILLKNIDVFDMLFEYNMLALNIDILPDILNNDILFSCLKRGKYKILYFPPFLALETRKV